MSDSRNPDLSPADEKPAEHPAALQEEINEYQTYLEETLTCPISMMIFFDPAFLPTLQTVERDYIKGINPYDRKKLDPAKLPTNLHIKKAVEGYLQINPDAAKRQYGYEQRQAEKEREARRLAQAALDGSLRDRELAHAIIQYGEEAKPNHPDPDFNYRQLEGQPPEAALPEIQQEGDPLERAHNMTIATLLTKMDAFTAELEQELEDMPYYAPYRTTWFFQLLFVSGLTTCITLLIFHIYKKHSIVDDMATTPAAAGSDQFCSSWLDDADIMTPCVYFNALGNVITAACQAQCNDIKDNEMNIIISGCLLFASAVGMLTTTLMLVDACCCYKQDKPKYDFTTRACQFNDPKQLALNQFSFALREESQQLFRYLNTYPEVALSEAMRVETIKAEMQRLRTELSGHALQEIVPFIPAAEGEAEIDIDPENPQSRQVLFYMIKAFNKQLDMAIFTSKTHFSEFGYDWMVGSLAMVGVALSIYFLTIDSPLKKSSLNSAKDTPSFPGSTRHCDAWIDVFWDSVEPCFAMYNQNSHITYTCEVLCHVIGKAERNVIIEGLVLAISLLSFGISAAVLHSSNGDQINALNWRSHRNQLPDNLHELAGTLFRRVNHYPDVHLTTQSSVREIKETLHTLQSRMMRREMQ